MILKAENISKDYLRKKKYSNFFTAVSETSLKLLPGTLTIVTGRSGSGKTTLLNMMSGLLAPSKGQVLADDNDIYAMEDKELSAFRNLNFGMIPQGQTAIFSLTVMENVLLPVTMYGVSKKNIAGYEEAKKYAIELLKEAGIGDLANEMPSDLSGGEMRRMAIARALIRKPQIIFADEPTGDLDDKNTKIVLSMLKNQAEEGKTVLLITHEKDAFEYADTLYRMDGGMLEKDSAR